MYSHRSELLTRTLSRHVPSILNRESNDLFHWQIGTWKKRKEGKFWGKTHYHSPTQDLLGKTSWEGRRGEKKKEAKFKGICNMMDENLRVIEKNSNCREAGRRKCQRKKMKQERRSGLDKRGSLRMLSLSWIMSLQVSPCLSPELLHL